MSTVRSGGLHEAPFNLKSVYGVVDSICVFPLFIMMVADIIAPKLSIIFCGVVRLGSFLECWRSTNVTAIPKSVPSRDREIYGPISVTPILSKMSEKLVSHKLSSFCENCFFTCGSVCLKEKSGLH